MNLKSKDAEKKTRNEKPKIVQKTKPTKKTPKIVEKKPETKKPKKKNPQKPKNQDKRNIVINQ